jgi:transportin-3
VAAKWAAACRFCSDFGSWFFFAFLCFGSWFGPRLVVGCQVPAWNVCHELVSSPDIPMQGRMLGAQTFRSKVRSCPPHSRLPLRTFNSNPSWKTTTPQITYDLSQLPQTQLRPLLDSLLTHLHTYSRPSSPSGSRAIIIQLCLAVADLAFQMPEWSDVIPSMIERFGRDPQGVVVLLEFLKVLVEESENTRLPISVRRFVPRSCACLR